MRKICVVFFCWMIFGIRILNAGEHDQCIHPHAEKSPFTFSKRAEPSEDGLIFREVTEESNIHYEGVSYGHAWADINNDGCPDFFGSGHGKPKLYMNNCDGTFIEIKFDFYKGYDTLPDGTLAPSVHYDLHGVNFADVNHDGWLDMYVPMGGDMGKSSGKMNGLFLNDNGTLVIENVSDQFGLKDSLGRGRSTLWVDLNGDDYLDAFLTNFNRTEGDFLSSVYQYNPQTGRYDNYSNVDIPIADYYGASLIRNEKEGKNFIVTVASNNNGVSVFDPSTLPFQNITRYPHWGSRDVAVGDFNGDAIQDFFIVSNIFGSEAVLFNDTTLLVYLSAKRGLLFYEFQNRVSFETEGNIRVESMIYPYMDDTKEYWRIGSDGYHPESGNFELDPTLDQNQNVVKNCLICLANYIGYNPNSNLWQLYSSDPIGNLRSAIKVTSSKPIRNIQTHNFENASLLSPDKLVIGIENGLYLPKNDFLTNEANLTSAVSVVAGDFDNDMDLDLIVACVGEAMNYPNKYYENDGDANFKMVAGFGAEGSKFGRVSAISTVDYNNDGFLDVFAENGEGTIDVNANGLQFNEGPYQLFMNKGNSNNWVKINLKDINSVGNKFANGAVVYCYAGGKKQVRLKGAENHVLVQNDAVIHFGLGSNEIVDSLEIIWPDGDVTKFYDLAVNKIYDISSKIVPVPTSKNDLKNKSFSIYPNPSSGTIRVEWNDIQSISHVKIFSSKGDLVYWDRTNKLTNYLDLNPKNSLSSGTYILQITHGGGNVSSQKLMIVD